MSHPQIKFSQAKNPMHLARKNTLQKVLAIDTHITCYQKPNTKQKNFTQALFFDL